MKGERVNNSNGKYGCQVVLSFCFLFLSSFLFVIGETGVGLNAGREDSKVQE